jgi:menaquinone-dependent protoporphyrinogen oxidase
MKTLIAYSTKYGATEEIARRIAGHFEEAKLHDLRSDGSPDIAPYECVIVGSPLYAGIARTEAKQFVTDSLDTLEGKRLGLFFSGMQPDEQDASFTANYPPEALEAAITAPHLGGIYDPKKANLAERLIMKAAAGKSGYVDSIDDDAISAFVAELGAGEQL